MFHIIYIGYSFIFHFKGGLKIKHKIILTFAILSVMLLAASTVSATNNLTEDATASTSSNPTDDVVSVDNETDFLQVTEDNQGDDVEEELSTNNENILTNSPGTLTDLRNEINDAVNELNLTRDYVFSSSDLNSGIISGKYITLLSGKNIIINGNGHYIQGKNEYTTTFEDLGKKVILNNITFKKIGRGIRLYGENSILCNCNFIDCESINLYPCVVIGNSLVENCTFINCKSTYDEYNHISEIFNSGGAIYADRYFNINNCTFINCMSYHINEDTSFARSYGGAIYCEDTGNITNCKFYKCSAETDVLAASYAYGGAIYCYSGFNNIINCSFTDCYSQSEYHSYGGAIYLDYHVLTSPLDLDYHNEGHCIIENCSFSNSQTLCLKGDDSYGGAIYSFVPTLTLTNCLFNNCGSNYGGAVYLKSMIGCDNIANIENCEFNGNLAKVAGAIYENNGTMVKMCKFINNTATNDAGALYMFRNYEYLSDCTFINNKASNNGAAIMWKGNDGSILSSIFVNNSASRDSGIFVEGGNTVVKDSLLFSNNQNPIICSDLYVVTANCNWWGNTIYNYNQQPSTPYRINVKNWLFMNFTFDTNSLNVGEIATITCDLTHLTTSNGVVTKYDAIDLPIINLTVISDNNNDTSISMIGGLCEAKYVATHTPTGNLTVKFNTIEETFYFNITSETISVKRGTLIKVISAGSNGIIGGILTDADNNPLAGKVISYFEGNDLKTPVITNANGFFEIQVLTSSKIFIYFDGTDEFSKSNATFTLNIIPVKKVSMIQIFSIVDGYQLNAILKDSEGNAISGATINYSLNNGNKLTATTDGEGMFTISVSNNCVVNMNYGGNDEFAPSNAFIILNFIVPAKKSTIIDVPSNMIKTAVDYNAGERGSMFYFYLKDGDGKAIANKPIKIGIFDKIYNTKTDKNGRAGLQINIANANYYTYGITFLGDDDYKASFAVCSLQIVKKSVTITPAKTSYTFKTTAKTKTVTATLKSSNAYIPKGKQVTLAIAGKTFKATIGNNGQISFNIGSITKKGTYKVTVNFAGTNTYNAATSKAISIKIA